MDNQNTDADAIKEMGLVYVSDSKPGITRMPSEQSFTYVTTNGTPVLNEKILLRIKQLVIPPAWQNVWICTKPNGYLQVTGKDVKGRKQYRYHKKWSQARGEQKFSKMISFGESLPTMRKKVASLLTGKMISRSLVLGLLVNILDRTLIRVGNKEYARSNNSFGLTTLRNKHLKLSDQEVKLDFIGKKGIRQQISITDRKAIALIKKCKELPGYDLFQYLDADGTLHAITSNDVNAFIKEISGNDFTAKDFRTWGGTAYAIGYILTQFGQEEKLDEKRMSVELCKHVAKKLGNTPTVCKSHYIHPHVFTLLSNSGSLQKASKRFSEQKANPLDLSLEEKVLLNILKKQEQAAQSVLV